MAKAYWIAAYRSITDPVALADYARLGGPALQKAGGRILARGIPAHVYDNGVSELVVLLISRREVETGDLASVLSRLKPFLASREEAWRHRGQMTLVVDGYDHDARELVDIPEVRTLLRRLEASWPHWAYFFNQVDDSITLLLSCVAGSRVLGRGAVEVDFELVAAALQRAFDGMNMIFDRFDFPEDELEKMSGGFIEVLQQAGLA